MIKTESGQWIPSTFKSGRYKTWQEKNKIEEEAQNSSEDEGEAVQHKTKCKFPILVAYVYSFFLSMCTRVYQNPLRLICFYFL